MLRIITLLFAGVLCTNTLAAQNKVKDTLGVDLRDNNYSNSKRPAQAKLYHDSFFVEDTGHTLVIIDDKIYKSDAPEYKQLKKDDIKSYAFIKDEQSGTGIHYIIIIKTKGAG